MAVRLNQGAPGLQTRALSPSSISTSLPPSSHARRSQPSPLPDAKSDEATAAFVKRVLSATSGPSRDAPISDILPPLTSSNDVDLQLYAYIALIVKQCVKSWYERFTPDQVFVDETIQVIAHCTRALEERARKTDLEVLLLDDIPALLHAHVSAYRLASRAAPAGSDVDQRAVYHSIRPHPALPLDTRLEGDSFDDACFRQYCHLLAQGLLAVLLPPGDLQNPCLQALVSEVSADLIIGNLIGFKFSDSAFIYDMIRRSSDIALVRLNGKRWAIDVQNEPRDRLSKFGLLSKGSRNDDTRPLPQKVSDMLVIIGQYALLALACLKYMIVIFTSGAPHRRRSKVSIGGVGATMGSPNALDLNKSPNDTQAPPNFKPVLCYRIWTAISEIICLDTRMPWAMSSLTLLYRLISKATTSSDEPDGRIDRVLAHHIIRPIFPLSKHLPTILLNLRLALFPDNSFPTGTGPSTASPLDPTVKASLAVRSRRAAAFAILNCIPRPLARKYLCTTLSPSDIPMSKDASPYDDPRERAEQAEAEAMVSDISDTVLEPFSDDYMNRHLVLAILERVLVALVPELGRDEDIGKAVAELLAERGVDVEDNTEAGLHGDQEGEGLGFRTNGDEGARRA